MHRHDEAGTSLIEIVIALVVLGGVVASLMAALVTSSTASNTHRDLVTADTVLRDYAEATKQAVRSSCTADGATYDVSYTPPNRFTVNALTAQPCPSATTTQPVHLTVTLPSGTTKDLDIRVRTP
jgi:type II secretory pathway pseudopilin PulG